jgi:hypothetical protein
LLPGAYVLNGMRTNIRLDSHLLAEARKVAAARGRTLTAVIEDALRESLTRQADQPSQSKRKLPTFRGEGLQPGVDLDDSVTLLDLMEDERDSHGRQRPDLRASRGSR